MMKSLLIISFAAIFLQLALAQSFEEQCLNKHNELRALHSAPPLELDPEIQAWSQEWADYLASTGAFEHRPDSPYGENIYGMYGATTLDGATPVQSWYDEINLYDWNNPGFSIEAGHFTQVVWGESQKLGCAISQSGTTIIVVANYDPPGNYPDPDVFAENVLPN